MERYSDWDSPGICTGTCFTCNIYIISMPNTVKLKLYLFADDAKLFRETTSDKDVELLQEK